MKPYWPSQYILGNKDPRRVQPIIDYLVKEVKQVDFNGESSFERALPTLFLWRPANDIY